MVPRKVFFLIFAFGLSIPVKDDQSSEKQVDPTVGSIIARPISPSEDVLISKTKLIDDVSDSSQQKTDESAAGQSLDEDKLRAASTLGQDASDDGLGPVGAQTKDDIAPDLSSLDEKLDLDENEESMDGGYSVGSPIPEENTEKNSEDLSTPGEPEDSIIDPNKKINSSEKPPSPGKTEDLATDPNIGGNSSEKPPSPGKTEDLATDPNIGVDSPEDPPTIKVDEISNEDPPIQDDTKEEISDSSDDPLIPNKTIEVDEISPEDPSIPDDTKDVISDDDPSILDDSKDETYQYPLPPEDTNYEDNDFDVSYEEKVEIVNQDDDTKNNKNEAEVLEDPILESNPSQKLFGLISLIGMAAMLVYFLKFQKQDSKPTPRYQALETQDDSPEHVRMSLLDSVQSDDDEEDEVWKWN